MRIAIRTWASSGAVAMALTLLLAACAATPPPGQSLLGRQCLSDLADRGVLYHTTRSPAESGPCVVTTPVEVSSAGVPWNRPALLSCDLAAVVDRFTVEAVQPMAQRYLGTRVTRLDHLGAYSCRAIAGLGGRWSEYATGRTIDIAGFLLATGERVSVEQDWRLPGPKSAFLHAVARRACDYFSVVLTPDSNRDHVNHFHLDLGRYKLCEA